MKVKTIIWILLIFFLFTVTSCKRREDCGENNCRKNIKITELADYKTSKGDCFTVFRAEGRLFMLPVKCD
jgi:hypothetical protein